MKIEKIYPIWRLSYKLIMQADEQMEEIHNKLSLKMKTTN